ncbi:hypothetical protein HZH68_001101 [Vespula germanica]|uniref:Uncharacterized protein n=1 Tax=Vespula germanica TaxID=30212 RepID=A0A834NUS0_VESGE|nr:hypothetical protein HZH68_001101 [Vespula germanica]
MTVVIDKKVDDKKQIVNSPRKCFAEVLKKCVQSEVNWKPSPVTLMTSSQRLWRSANENKWIQNKQKSGWFYVRIRTTEIPHKGILPGLEFREGVVEPYNMKPGSNSFNNTLPSYCFDLQTKIVPDNVRMNLIGIIKLINLFTTPG